jgi:hypothetical protein
MFIVAEIVAEIKELLDQFFDGDHTVNFVLGVLGISHKFKLEFSYIFKKALCFLYESVH